MIKLPIVLEDLARYILINNPHAKMSVRGDTIFIEADNEIIFDFNKAWEKIPDEIKNVLRNKTKFRKFLKMVTKPKARIVRGKVVIRKRYYKEVMLRFSKDEWLKIERWAEKNNLLHLSDSGLIKHIISLVVGELE